MEKPSISAKSATETWLRVSMLMFWFMLGVETFGTSNGRTLISIPPVLAFTEFLGFGLSLWLNTGNISQLSTGRMPALLLVFQSVCGFTTDTDLLYIVAAEIPLVLSGRPAVIWITVQTLMLTLWIYWLDRTGASLRFLSLPQLPHLLVMLLTDMEVFAIHGFAFFMGYLAASEARGRRAAERLNAELMATREMLAQTSRMAERGYIAQELHDTLGHHLVALKLNLDLAQRLTEGTAVAPLSDARVLVEGLLSSVREVVSEVRTQSVMDLRRAIEMLLSGIMVPTVRMVFPEDLEVVDPAHAHALFRCVQEAITNMIKHARSRQLWIEFDHDEERITLQIRDDGQGAARFEPGYGLKGMRERLEASGGALEIQTAAGQGFALTAWLPKQGGQR